MLFFAERQSRRGGHDAIPLECAPVFSKAINKIYEEFVLTEGDFDERVFLDDDVDIELGTPIKGQPPETRNAMLRNDVAEHLASVSFCSFSP